MNDTEMLQWLVYHPEVTVRRVIPEGFVAWDQYNGLVTLARGPNYRGVIQDAADKLKEQGR